MHKEIEAKFIRVNPEDVRARLGAAGAQLVMPMTLLKRAILDTPEMNREEAFMRVRDEGDRITMVYKQHARLALGGANEIPLGVDDFHMAIQLLEKIGLIYKSYQETRRETWTFNNTQITIDEWPWLDPLIEVESESEEAVQATANTLGFEWKDAVFGGIMVVYQEKYPGLTPTDSIINLREVKFDTPLPDMLKG